ncbi:hypothetical protein [Deinococcus budaensis]|uniref:Uncharacterized protein n=1 Tax=Deinococcus budaensis TaxID=1665626 RepID=A0A7W8GED0_9DEIO|nr:hypothetical protein [Deinococcus budaensis]MBB5234015.1 hypothetical protein [Deinococcus budaensis]
MTPGDPPPTRPSVFAGRLRQVLARPELPGAALEEVVQAAFGAADPLAALGAALRGRGVPLELPALAGVAWGLLGVTRPRAVQLGAAADARLTHLAELHDVAVPSAARTLAARLAGERDLAPDLRRVRPGWVPDGGDTAALLEAVFREEGAGFLALPGEFGPWAYLPGVADLQELSRAYGALVRAASASGEREVLTAALLLQARAPLGAAPLLARLEAAAYRPQRGPARPGPAPAELVALEDACWSAAARIAREQRARWTRPRRG